MALKKFTIQLQLLVMMNRITMQHVQNQYRRHRQCGECCVDKNVKKMLHVSSIAAIGGKPNEVLTEETKWEKNEWTTHYGITKMLAEREIWRGIAGRFRCSDCESRNYY
jgi:nucleoside-diphosphate-sugar epimerase